MRIGNSHIVSHRSTMKILGQILVLLPVTVSSISLAQTPNSLRSSATSASTEPLIADVHAAPYRPSIVYTTNVSHQRFDMRMRQSWR